MTEMLVAEGYAVAEASNGQIALELAEQLQPAVIVLDLALPGRSGQPVRHVCMPRATSVTRAVAAPPLAGRPQDSDMNATSR